MSLKTFTFWFIQVWLKHKTPVSCPYHTTHLNLLFQLNTLIHLQWFLLCVRVFQRTHRMLCLNHFLMWPTEVIKCRLNRDSVMWTDFNLSDGECQGVIVTTKFKPASCCRHVCDCVCTYTYTYAHFSKNVFLQTRGIFFWELIETSPPSYCID